MKKLFLLSIFGFFFNSSFSQWETVYFSPTELPWLFGGDFLNFNYGFVIGDEAVIPSKGYILRTLNNGTNWDTIFSLDSVLLSDIDVINSNKIIAIGNNKDYSGFALISNDSGQTWVSTNIPNSAYLKDITFTSDSVGYILGSNVHKTLDGGNSWNFIHFGDAFCFLNDTVGFVCSGNYVYKTTDGGISWQNIFVSGNGLIIDISFPSDSIGYLLKRKEISGTYYDAFYKSEDGGDNWNLVTPWFIGAPSPPFILFTNDSTGYYCGQLIVKITTNGGITWEPQFSTPPSWGNFMDDLSEIFFINNDTGFIVGSSQFYRTIMGGKCNVNLDISQSLDTLKSESINSTYQWINCFDTSAILGETNQFFIPASNGSYAVRIADSICYDTSTCYNVNWFGNCSSYYTLYPDTIPQHWFAVNQATGIPPLNYYWHWGDGDTSIGSTPSHIYSDSGYYNICLTIEDSAGCISAYCDSSTYINKKNGSIITINVVMPSTGISEQSGQIPSLKIIPNPNSGKFNIQCSIPNIQGTVTIHNILGEKIYQTFLDTEHQYRIPITIDFTSQPKGIYFIQLESEGNISLSKLILE